MDQYIPCRVSLSRSLSLKANSAVILYNALALMMAFDDDS